MWESPRTAWTKRLGTTYRDQKLSIYHRRERLSTTRCAEECRPAEWAPASSLGQPYATSTAVCVNGVRRSAGEDSPVATVARPCIEPHSTAWRRLQASSLPPLALEQPFDSASVHVKTIKKQQRTIFRR